MTDALILHDNTIGARVFEEPFIVVTEYRGMHAGYHPVRNHMVARLQPTNSKLVFIDFDGVCLIVQCSQFHT